MTYGRKKTLHLVVWCTELNGVPCFRNRPNTSFAGTVFAHLIVVLKSGSEFEFDRCKRQLFSPRLLAGPYSGAHPALRHRIRGCFQSGLFLLSPSRAKLGRVRFLDTVRSREKGLSSIFNRRIEDRRMEDERHLRRVNSCNLRFGCTEPRLPPPTSGFMGGSL